MINELHVPVFTAFITGFIEPFSVGVLYIFKGEIFIIFGLKENRIYHVKQCHDIIISIT